MKIFICGSMSIAKKMIEVQKKLEEMGHSVKIPCDAKDYAKNEDMSKASYEDNYKWCIENDIIRRCFDSLAECDAILMLNYPRNGIDGYVGAAGLMEIALAYYLKMKIFLLYPPPPVEKAKSSEEIFIMQPIIIDGDLSLIKKEL